MPRVVVVRRRRCPAFTAVAFRATRASSSLADPPTAEEIVAVMRHAGASPHGLRMRALIVLLWRAGLRIAEALSLAESDLDRARGSILVRRGKNGKRREVGMDAWACPASAPARARR
jgi:site-specific recombinase XerD